MGAEAAAAVAGARPPSTRARELRAELGRSAEPPSPNPNLALTLNLTLTPTLALTLTRSAELLAGLGMHGAAREARLAALRAPHPNPSPNPARA